MIVLQLLKDNAALTEMLCFCALVNTMSMTVKGFVFLCHTLSSCAHFLKGAIYAVLHSILVPEGGIK